MKRRLIMGAIVLALLVSAPAARADDGVRTVGNALNIALPLTAAVATIGHHDGVGAKQLALSLGVTWGVTFALKRAINETRPNGGDYSFPSGHSSSSFASAEFMRRRYGWKWGVPAYALAAFVAYSRVESRMHYTHDVVAGAAIGVASSLIFTKPHRSWTATVAGDTSGARFTFSRVW
jgi:membrane-associated phospholipid phosphatase